MEVSSSSSQCPPRSSSKLPLRLLLIVPFVLEISVAVGLTGYLSLRNGQKAVSDLASQLRHEVSERVDQQIHSYLEAPAKLSQLNAKSIEMGLLEPSNLEQIGQFFWHQVRSNSVGYILFGSKTGELVATGYYADDAPLTIGILSPQRNGNQNSYAYETDNNGNRTKLNFVFENYAFQKEDWYAKTLQLGKSNWTSVYQWESEPYPLSISAGYPVYDKNKRLIGAIGVDLRLKQMSEFLNQMKVSPAAQVFIMERNGLLIASSSTNEALYTLSNNKPSRLNAINSKEPIIQETADYLIEKFGTLSNIQTSQQLDFVAEGQRKFIQVTPLKDALGIDWLVVVAMPESDFMMQINANTQTTILLCLLALCLAIVLGLYTSRWITQPIWQLSQASENLAKSSPQEFSMAEIETTIAQSKVNELGALAQSFHQMAQQLSESFTTLEETNEQLEIRVQERTEELSQALYDLQQTQAQLVQNEKMSSLGQLVAGVAHEINNPVNFIHGNLVHTVSYIQTLLGALALYQKHYNRPVEEIQNYIEDEDLDFLVKDLPHLLSSMKEGTARIRNIVLSLRNFSRLDEMGMKAVDIHEGIDSTLLILKNRFKGRISRPEIEVIKSYGQIPPVPCYAGRLNQVFMNLLVNSIDALEEMMEERDRPVTQLQDRQQNTYALATFDRLATERFKTPQTEPFSPKIWISTHLTADDRVAIHIRDNGPGIPSEVVSKVFDPFFTTKPVGQGTGLGLSISYQIVTQQHNGKLYCNSIAGGGTEFIIEIPC